MVSTQSLSDNQQCSVQEVCAHYVCYFQENRFVGESTQHGAVFIPQHNFRKNLPLNLQLTQGTLMPPQLPVGLPLCCLLTSSASFLGEECVRSFDFCGVVFNYLLSWASFTCFSSIFPENSFSDLSSFIVQAEMCLLFFILCNIYIGDHIYKYLSNTVQYSNRGLSQGELVVKNTPANAGDLRDVGLVPELGRSAGEGNATQVFLPGESHGHRSLAGYSLQDCKVLDMNEET